MRKIILLIFIINTLASSANAQSLNCGNICILSIGNLDTLNNNLNVTIYNGDTNHVNYPVVVLTNALGDTVANINQLGYFFVHPSMDTLTHTIPTTLDSLPSGFTGTIYFTDDAYNITCSIPYPSMICTVGINEMLSKSNSVNVFPNPVSKTINIQFKNLRSNANITIYDINGRIVKEGSTTENNITIERGNLQKGIYFLNVLIGNQRSLQKLILE